MFISIGELKKMSIFEKDNLISTRRIKKVSDGGIEFYD